ncbi:hypothetical protein Y032_0060g3187 [Ancylostoma ceylanicum]|uniref:Uncharacterized protein n=1 Tax=Ancylostoma ceylanicum TaxID=53326 RepID=A0A016U4R0_9BILA|nr:hypothetical protein Y032_0060g3187 [Ancylostoma ceylanicum]
MQTLPNGSSCKPCQMGRHTNLGKWVAIQTLPNGLPKLTKCVFMQALIIASSFHFRTALEISTDVDQIQDVPRI